MTETRKTGTFDENEIIAAAKQLGIKLTNAEKDLTRCRKILLRRAVVAARGHICWPSRAFCLASIVLRQQPLHARLFVGLNLFAARQNGWDIPSRKPRGRLFQRADVRLGGRCGALPGVFTVDAKGDDRSPPCQRVRNRANIGAGPAFAPARSWIC